MRKAAASLLSVAVVVMTTALVAVGSSATSGASSKSTITIGYISTLTGVAASTFLDGPGGAQAVIDEVNAKGGVNGHKLKLVVENDASTTTQNLHASEELVQDDHATVIIDFSSFAFGGAAYLAKERIPVVGAAFDGPEWATKGDTNMFTWDPPEESPVNGKLYTTTGLGVFLKDLGVKSFGGLGYGISPSSTDSILEAEKSVEAEGIKVCYTNNTVTFGATTFTADVLQIKAAGCGAIAGSFVESSDIGLSTEMRNAGLTKVVQVFFTGYTSATTATPSARAGFDGDYVEAGIDFSPPNAAGKSFLALLKKYDPSYTGGIPGLGLYGSAISAQLAVYGLEIAGSDPTSASFIKNLRKVKSWNDTGLLLTPVGFTGYGTSAMFPKKDCGYLMKLTAGKWKTYSGKAICGTLITMPAPAS
jgi:branched-chain amino acid transport system substrate-binding protein